MEQFGANLKLDNSLCKCHTFSVAGSNAVYTFSSVIATNTSPETSSFLCAGRNGNHLSKPVHNTAIYYTTLDICSQWFLRIKA